MPGDVLSMDGLGRTLPQVSNELENSALPGFWRLGFFDRLDVFALETKRQAIKDRSRFRDLVQSRREICRLRYYSWLSVEFKNNWIRSASAMRLAALLAALIPIKHCPRIRATLLRQV